MLSISKFLSPRRRPLWLALLAFLLLASLTFFKLGEDLENRGLDLCYQLRPLSLSPPELVVVGIDEPSFQELRQAWPWPRRFHAELVRRLKALGARLIVFDVIFAEPTDAADDGLFAQAIREAGNVILAQTLEVTEDPHFSRRILVQPLEEFRRAAKGVALTMVTPDADGLVRRFRLRLGDAETLPELVVKILRPQLDIPPGLSGLIYFSGPPRHIRILSYYQVLDQAQPPPDSWIRGHIVLIGRMLEASPTPQADAFYTPFFAGTGQLMAGVEIQGQIIHTLLRRRWGKELDLPSRLGLYLMVSLLFSFLVSRLSPLKGLSLLGGLLLLLGGTSLALFLRWNFWLPPVLLSGGLVLIYAGHIFAQHLVESQEKRWLRQAFGTYVSPTLVEAIIARPDRLQLGGEEVEVTVLFADLERFATLSEDMAPRELISLLNDYFSAMTEVILAHQGTLDKYIGDSLMALWGAPLPLVQHASLACQAALEMQTTLRCLRRDWRARGLPPLTARIGLHSGPVIAGNVGSRQRFNYTVMGDTVNLASRLEEANKQYGTEILLSEATYRRLDQTFLVRELDQVQVRGRAQPVIIYELLGPWPDTGLPPWMRLFAEGRASYLERQWRQAAAQFQEVFSLKPEDPPTKLYLRRCDKYLQKPPPPDWKGVHILENK